MTPKTYLLIEAEEIEKLKDDSYSTWAPTLVLKKLQSTAQQVDMVDVYDAKIYDAYMQSDKFQKFAEFLQSNGHKLIKEKS